MKTYFTMLIRYSFILFLPVIALTCSDRKDIKILITNPTDLSISDGLVSVEIKDKPDSFSLYDGEKEIPYQVFTSAEKKEIGFVLNLKPLETKVLFIKRISKNHKSEFKSRTYAELSMKTGGVYIDGKFRGDHFVNVQKIKVPGNHTDHDALFRYEGPGWESEKVGYRFYLDWRNANDIFGKKVNKLLLSGIGIHDTVAQDDSYHSMLDWGMDIFKVGNSLGIGSIGMWYNNKVYMVFKTDSVICEIAENGPIRSAVKSSYFGWKVGDRKYDLFSTLSITAGSRLTKCELEISNQPENIVTGLAKYEGTNFIRNSGNEEWTYIALYGNQTLVGPEDKLGIAIFYKRIALMDLTEDDLSYVLKLKPNNGRAEYYFCAAWEQEPNGIKTKNDFIKYLDDTMELLNRPLLVKVE